MSKYKVGDKFVIEIDKHMTNKDGDLYGVKPFKAMVMDDYGLDQLTPYKERDCPECQDEWQDRVDASFDDDYKHGYNEGLTRAWLFVKALADIQGSEGDKIFGNLDISDIVERYTVQDAIKKYEDYIKAQEEAKKKAEEEIKVGDEVVNTVTKSRFVVYSVAGNSKYWGISPDYECPQRLSNGKKDYVKTGRHFDIQSILDAMQMQPHDPEKDLDIGNWCNECKYADVDIDDFPCGPCCYGGGDKDSSYHTKETE